MVTVLYLIALVSFGALGVFIWGLVVYTRLAAERTALHAASTWVARAEERLRDVMAAGGHATATPVAADHQAGPAAPAARDEAEATLAEARRARDAARARYDEARRRWPDRLIAGMLGFGPLRDV